MKRRIIKKEVEYLRCPECGSVVSFEEEGTFIEWYYIKDMKKGDRAEHDSSISRFYIDCECGNINDYYYPTNNGQVFPLKK